MKAFQEITDWGNERVVNHIYFLSDSKDKMYAYVNKEGQVDEVKTPYRFHVRGRKFKEVPNVWGFFPREELIPVKGEFKVTGSRGDIYTVTEEQGVWSCTCPASKWQKGECKHIKSLQTA